jgi:cadmium resistance protein CadD (predicted permease)
MHPLSVNRRVRAGILVTFMASLSACHARTSSGHKTLKLYEIPWWVIVLILLGLMVLIVAALVRWRRR